MGRDGDLKEFTSFCFIKIKNSCYVQAVVLFTFLSVTIIPENAFARGESIYKGSNKHLHLMI